MQRLLPGVSKLGVNRFSLPDQQMIIVAEPFGKAAMSGCRRAPVGVPDCPHGAAYIAAQHPRRVRRVCLPEMLLQKMPHFGFPR